jgi:hypothetical protein
MVRAMTESIDEPIISEPAPAAAAAASEAFATVDALYRYPVKGLTPERLELIELKAGEYFPGDRMFAIENGVSGFDPETPDFQPKIKFLMLMRNERLAALDTRYEDDTSTLVIRHEDTEAVRGDLKTPEGRAAIEAFFQCWRRRPASVSSTPPRAMSR